MDFVYVAIIDVAIAKTRRISVGHEDDVMLVANDVSKVFRIYFMVVAMDYRIGLISTV